MSIKLDDNLFLYLGGLAILLIAAYEIFYPKLKQQQQQSAVVAAANSLPIFEDCGD